MPEQNGQSQSPDSASDLDAFDRKLKDARARREAKMPKRDMEDNSGSLLGLAWRLSTELLVSVLVGWGLGFGLDKLFGTTPWITLVGIGFGFAAGIMTVLRTSAEMDRKTAHLPKGEALPDIDD